MISILIVEDDLKKLASIQCVIAPITQEIHGRVETACCSIEARDWLSRRQFDILILDLLLPNRPDDTPEPDGGATLLDEISVSKTLIKPGYVIGLTSHEDAFTKSIGTFNSYLWTLLRFDAASKQWANQLSQHIRYIIASQSYFLANRHPAYDYDVGLVVALPDPELSAILETESIWTPRNHATTSNTYYETSIRDSEGNKLRIIAASCPQMGNVASCSLTSEMILLHRPKLMFLLGICGGADKTSQSLQDIVISDEVILHDSGKIKEKDSIIYLHPDPKSLQISPALKSAIQNPLFTNNVKQALKKRFGLSTPQDIHCHIGPIASGSCVIAAERAMASIKERIRKLQAVEMEGYGFAYACEYAAAPKPEWLIIKGICDFADANKGNEFQSKAAATSIIYAEQLMSLLKSRHSNYFNHI